MGLFETCPGLDGELIERNVIADVIEGGAKLFLPGFERLAWPRIDEIEAHPLEMPSGERESGKCFGTRMPAAEEAKLGVVERLHAEGDPVHARRGVTREAAGLDRGWIGLKRDLDPIVDTPVP